MCSPIAVGAATAALAVGSSVVGYAGELQLAKANEKAANFTYAHDRNAIDQRRIQLDQAKSENAFDTAITAIQGQGKIAASAADRGLTGSSVIHQLNTNMFGIGRQASVEDINDTNARQQLSMDVTGADMKRQTAILQHPRPSVAGLILGIGKGGLAGFNAAQGAK